MRLFKIIMPLAILLICGCTSDVERINKEIDTEFDSQLSNDLHTVVATMRFKLYANPENFWYSGETTTKDIIEDEFKEGYRKLGNLDDLISQIQTNNSGIKASIDTLHNSIIKALKDIKKAQKALEQANSIFGFGLFGGASTLYDFANLLGSNSKNEDETNQMPKEVGNAFANLKDAVHEANNDFLNNTYKFELNMIRTREFTDEQMAEIRTHLKQTISAKVKLYFIGTDTLARNESTLKLMNSYDTYFSIETNSTLRERNE